MDDVKIKHYLELSTDTSSIEKLMPNFAYDFFSRLKNSQRPK